ncbi:MAG TPA: gluconokinase [Steroidobacteraceae bacterium]|nr:gluconokinase [Steroidobacteraceae bacterium]
MTRALVVMGVTASGKSTLGQALARALGWTFIEGDTLHPAANIAKMASGRALDDQDRIPFLDNVARAIASRTTNVVISCSALKRAYRDRLRRAEPALLFLLPEVRREVLQRRLQQRGDHFMPATLLDSQLADLEPPRADEAIIRIDGEAPLDAQVSATVAALTAGKV